MNLLFVSLVFVLGCVLFVGSVLVLPTSCLHPLGGGCLKGVVGFRQALQLAGKCGLVSGDRPELRRGLKERRMQMAGSES